MELYAVPYQVRRGGGVFAVEDDVQNVVRGIKEISDRLHVFYNEQSGGFDIVEHCLDGAQRLVCSVAELDHRVIHRLREADHWHGQDIPTHVLNEGEDVTARVDAHNAQLEADRDEAFRGELAEIGERFMWALDAVKDRPSKGGSVLIPRSIDG